MDPIPIRYFPDNHHLCGHHEWPEIRWNYQAPSQRIFHSGIGLLVDRVHVHLPRRQVVHAETGICGIYRRYEPKHIPDWILRRYLAGEDLPIIYFTRMMWQSGNCFSLGKHVIYYSCLLTVFSNSQFFLTQFLCQAICTQRTPKGPK